MREISKEESMAHDDLVAFFKQDKTVPPAIVANTKLFGEVTGLDGRDLAEWLDAKCDYMGRGAWCFPKEPEQ